MTTFTIDVHDNITALGSDEQAKDNPEAERFGSAQELASLAEKWPATRLVEIWNSLPGQKPVKRFTSRPGGCRPGLEGYPEPGPGQWPTGAPGCVQKGAAGETDEWDTQARYRPQG